MNKRKLTTLLVLVLIMVLLPVKSLQAASSKPVTIKKFSDMLIKSTSSEKNIKKAVLEEIQNKTLFPNVSAEITNQEAAYLLDKVYQISNANADKKNTGTKDWVNTISSFVIPVKAGNFLKTEKEELYNNAETSLLVFEKAELLLEELKVKYPEYDIQAGEVIEASYKPKNYNINYLFSFTTEAIQFPTSFEPNNTTTIFFPFKITDYIYSGKDKKMILNDLKNNYKAEFKEDQTDYKKISLTTDDIIERIKENERITDIKKAKKYYREAIYRCYGRGIMTGFSNGKYTMGRSFKPFGKVNTEDAAMYISRQLETEQRGSFTADGQLIRATNLPFNSNEWKYILDSVPNEFYTLRYSHETVEALFGTGLNLKENQKKVVYSKAFSDIYYPAAKSSMSMDNMLEDVRDNLYLRLNTSYKTINSKWLSQVTETLDSFPYIGMSQEDVYLDKNNKKVTIRYDKKTKYKEYEKLLKKNKASIKSESIYVNPDYIYYDGSYMMIRCYVKFKINWTGKVKNPNELLFKDYGDTVHLDGLKSGKSIEGIFDVKIDLPSTSKKIPIMAFHSDFSGGPINSIQYLKTKNVYGFKYIKDHKLVPYKKGNVWNWK